MPFKYQTNSNLPDFFNVGYETQDLEFIKKLEFLPEKINKPDIDNLLKDIPGSKYQLSVRLLIDYISKRKTNKIENMREVCRIYSFLPDNFCWWEERENVFTEDYLEKLKNEVTDTRYSNKNSLNRMFATTRGFNIYFKPAYKDKVIKHFPFFKDYIEAIFDDDIDVFFMNVLILRGESKVDKHIDLSMGRYDRTRISPPSRVSVLYVDVPDMYGGELVLYNNFNDVCTRIKPQKNKLICFRGSLPHEVTDVIKNQPSDDTLRISLVCEQYKLGKDVLQKIPNFLTEVPRSVWYSKPESISLQI